MADVYVAVRAGEMGWGRPPLNVRNLTKSVNRADNLSQSGGKFDS